MQFLQLNYLSLQLKCFNKKTHSGTDLVFRCQFHTAVVGTSLRLVYKREELDDAFKDKRFPDSTKVELIFESADHSSSGNGTEGIEEAADIRTSLMEAQVIEQLRGEHEKISKRNSYDSFEGGFDSGLPGDRVPDLIQFSPTLESQRDRSASTESSCMDPEMIERVAPPLSEELYTVVSKQAAAVKGNPSKVAAKAVADVGRRRSPPLLKLPSKPPPPAKMLSKVASHSTQLSTSTGSKSSKPLPATKPKVPKKPTAVIPDTEALYTPVDEDDRDSKDIADESQQARSKKKHVVSYDEINPDRPIIIRPLAPRLSAQDNDMWVQFKFQTLPTKSDSLLTHRSSSSSNLSSDYYSNLAEVTSGGDGCTTDCNPEPTRRHSFSDGDSRLLIKATASRESIIPISVTSVDGQEPEYGNVDTGAAVYAEPYVQQSDTPKYVNTDIVNGQADEEEVYENRDPEGLAHVYSNQGALLAQLRQGNIPTPERSVSVSEVHDTAQASQPLSKLPASLLKFIPSQLMKPKPPLEIHSAKISEEDRHQTLAMFQLSSGTAVGRDYEAFFKKSAWGETSAKAATTDSGATAEVFCTVQEKSCILYSGKVTWV